MKNFKTALLTAALACSMSTGVFAASCPLTTSLNSCNSTQIQNVLGTSTYKNLCSQNTNFSNLCKTLGGTDSSTLASKNCSNTQNTNLTRNKIATNFNNSVKNNGSNSNCTGSSCNLTGNTTAGNKDKSTCTGSSCNGTGNTTASAKDKSTCTGSSCNNANGNATCADGSCDGTNGKSTCNGPSCNTTSTTANTSNNNNNTVNETPSTDTTSSESQFVAEVVRLVNVERAKAGLNPVTADTKIAAAALVRSKEQVQSFSHTRPNGSSCFTVLAEQGVSYNGAGENIAMGQKTPAAVMQAWMNSEGHRANILNKNFTKIGVGYYVNGGTAYWTQLFTY